MPSKNKNAQLPRVSASADAPSARLAGRAFFRSLSSPRNTHSRRNHLRTFQSAILRERRATIVVLTTKISTPCIQLCRMQGDFCVGCYRTLDEITNWSAMSEHERLHIMKKILRQRAAAFPFSDSEQST